MRRRFRKGSAVSWAIVAGSVSLAVGVVVGALAIHRDEAQSLPLPVFATATHGQDNFAICTGEMEDGIEAIFFLDYLSGELKAAVMNVRNRRFQAFFQRSIVNDLGTREVKNPRYLMVTGVADLQRGVGAAQRVGRSVVYVAELNSGVCVAYAIPFITPKANIGFQTAGPMIPLDRLEFRSVKARERE